MAGLGGFGELVDGVDAAAGEDGGFDEAHFECDMM